MSLPGNKFSYAALLLAANLAAPTAADDVARTVAPPNVLFIVSDDLSTDLGCYGNSVVRTPHIDRLAQRGVRFTRAYCQSTVCNSSRASIFSGLYPLATGVLDNETPWPAHLPNSDLMPAYFQKLGFFTATFGKVLDHKRVPEQPYWDLEVREWGKYPEDDQILKQDRLFHNSTGSMFWAQLKGPDATTPDGQMAVAAVQMLENRARGDQPFFAAVGFRRPHTPYAAPSKYFELYSPDQVAAPKVPRGYRQTLPPGVVDLKPFVGTTVQTKQAIVAYYACISYIDRQVGVLLDALDRLELWDNTVVVFFSDHGYHAGHQGLWHKGWLFEQTTRTPMIVAAPNVEAGVCERVVQLIDLYPTLVDLCSLTAPSALPGTSLVPLLNDPQAPRNQPALSSVGVLDADHRRMFVGHSVRTANYRYTQWDGGRQGDELYSFADDPAGINNRSNDPALTGQRSELKEILHQLTGSH